LYLVLNAVAQEPKYVACSFSDLSVAWLSIYIFILYLLLCVQQYHKKKARLYHHELWSTNGNTSKKINVNNMLIT